MRKIYGPMKEEENWRIRMYKEINDILQWPDIVKFITSLKGVLDIFGRMNNERLPKHSSDCQNGRNEEKRKTMEKEADDVEGNLRTTGIRKWHTAATDRKEQRRTELEAKVQNRLQCSRRRRRRGKKRRTRSSKRIT